MKTKYENVLVGACEKMKGVVGGKNAEWGGKHATSKNKW